MNVDSKRIVLIEDDATIRMIVTNYLSTAGHTVVGAVQNGIEGLNLIKTVLADLVIIDLGLPDVNGIDLIKIINNQYSIPVVVLSADEDPETVRAAGEAGAMSYLVKPPRARELDRAIDVAIIRFRYQSELKSMNVLLAKEITERKAAEEQILENEFKYRQLFETSRDGIAVLDFNDNITQCNRAFIDLCGFSTMDEICNINHYDIISEEYHTTYKRICNEQVLKRGWSDEYELQYIKTSGMTIHVNIRIWLTRNRNGDPSGMWLFVRDISRLKAAEERIFQFDKMEAIGQLAGGIAHDFNNQLSGIVGYADLLSDTLSNDETNINYVKKILAGAHRATELTTKLLAFARKGKYQFILLDMHSIITDVIELLKRSIDKTIIIEKVFTTKAALIDGDPSQWHNAILNLSINACDAMPAGGILTFTTNKIRIDMDLVRSIYPEIVPGDYLKIEIRDSGSGIDEGTRKHIFEPFFSSKRAGTGTGLDLAAVYGTVKNHFGVISVDSKKDVGTVFEILIPISQKQADLALSNTEVRPDFKGSGVILLIDDDDLVCEMTQEILRKMGYYVILCKDGIDGIEMYKNKQKSIDLIIMDMIMPKLNGYETFLRLKKINPLVKVLLSSGYSVELHAQRLLKEGAAGLVQKPFTISELSSKINSVLNG